MLILEPDGRLVRYEQQPQPSRVTALRTVLARMVRRCMAFARPQHQRAMAALIKE